jgi:hypothetical protein
VKVAGWWFQASLGKSVRPYQKLTEAERAGGMAQVICLVRWRLSSKTSVPPKTNKQTKEQNNNFFKKANKRNSSREVKYGPGRSSFPNLACSTSLCSTVDTVDRHCGDSKFGDPVCTLHAGLKKMFRKP